MDNIRPAISKTDVKYLREVSSDEFQRMLNTWFEEKGLVQDLKSYLKFQMINVLKNTTLGKNIKKNASQPFTLGQQALHLIVAEYLLFHHCHFALSLFNTEVNLSNVLPDAKLFFDTSSMHEEADKKFDKENLVSILELLGISKQNPHFKRILFDYFEKSRQPVLVGLLSLLSKDTSETVSENQNEADIEYDDDFMKNIHVILQTLNIPQKSQMKIMQNMKVCYDLKIKSYETQVVQLVNKFKKELHSVELKLHHSQKRRKHLEKQINKLRGENDLMKENINILQSKENIVENEKFIEKVVTTPCSLNHCGERCLERERASELYKREIEKLKNANTKQKEEINKLTLRHDELRKEMSCYQDKVNLLNIRLQEETDSQLLRNHDEDFDSISVSSDSTTEQILQEARQKLRQLEEESDALDIRFTNFVIK